MRLRLGVFDHLGWAVVVTASPDHEVVDRRRIELVEAGVTQAPIHYESAQLDATGTLRLVAEVRRSAIRATATEMDAIVAALPGAVESMFLRTWPPDFPDDIETLRRPPYEARADAVMYRKVLAEAAAARGWDVHTYDAKTVEREAAELLGARADEVLKDPRERLGPPWTKDHRVALAATVVGG